MGITSRLLVVLAVILTPTLAHAQATVAGTVRDSSGAVLPGVSVEVTSTALIERVRSAASDSSGQYRITELPPGTYAVTFSISGFTTLRRDAITVSGSGVIPVNAELSVGNLTETVVV